MVEISKFKKSALAQLKGRKAIPFLAFLIVNLVNLLFNTISILFPSLTKTIPLLSLIESVATIFLFFAAIKTIFILVKKNEPVTFSDYTSGFEHGFQPLLANWWETLWLMLWILIAFIPLIIYMIVTSETNLIGKLPLADDYTSALLYIKALFSLIANASPVVWFTFAALFIVIILKSLQYEHIDFIISENKKLSVTKALRFSIEFMKGNLLSGFLLKFSFIFFYVIVRSSNLLVFPLKTIMAAKYAKITSYAIYFILYAIFEVYYYTTRANFYLDAKSKAIEKAKINAQEIYNSNQNYFNNNSVDFENPKEIEDLIDRLYYSNNISPLNETTKIVLIQIIKENKNA